MMNNHDYFKVGDRVTIKESVLKEDRPFWGKLFGPNGDHGFTGTITHVPVVGTLKILWDKSGKIVSMDPAYFRENRPLHCEACGKLRRNRERSKH